MRSVVLPALATYVIDRVPVLERGTVTLFARLSPSGKFSVDEDGLLWAVGVTATYPAAACRATVTLPVTATALAGMGGLAPRPVTWNVRAVEDTNLPASPDRPLGPSRLSTIRTGVIGT